MSIRARAPWLTASAICLRTNSAAEARTIGPSVVSGDERIAELVAVRQSDEAVDETVVDVLVHVDALDGAAALPRIEEAAVDQVLDRVVEIGVGAHIGRVLAAELEAGADEARGSGALHGVAALDRTGECDEIDLGRGDQPFRVGMRQMHDLEHARPAGRRP